MSLEIATQRFVNRGKYHFLSYSPLKLDSWSIASQLADSSSPLVGLICLPISSSQEIRLSNREGSDARCRPNMRRERWGWSDTKCWAKVVIRGVDDWIDFPGLSDD